MKALFVHDHKLRRIQNKIYTPGGLPESVLRRYINIFGALTVIGRIYDESEGKDTYSLIDSDSIRFVNFLEHPVSVVREEVQKADVVIARIPSMSGFLAIIFAKIYKTTCIAEVVGSSSSSLRYSGKYLGVIVQPIATILMKYLVKHARYVSYVSRRFLQKEYPTKGISVGIPDVFLEEPLEETLERRLSKIKTMPPKQPSLGLIGSLDVNYRGQKTLFYCVKELEKKQIYATVHLLGAGDTTRWLNLAKKLNIEDRIYFDGVLPAGEKVMNWIDDVDILIMPAKQETLGRAIIEAMSRGCPVIGSLETAIGEQIGSDCLTMSDDYKGIADIVSRMVENKDYMVYCAKENFYRSFKYSNKQTDAMRNDFMIMVRRTIENNNLLT